MSLDAIIQTRFGTFDPHVGLPDELFDYVRRVVPMVGVELIIHSEEKGFLLRYRDDAFYKGWHFVGGLLRFRESWSERIQKTAKNEIGTPVVHDAHPFQIVENIEEDMDPRTHSINLLFHCTLTDTENCKSLSDGELGWFKEMPRNILKMHTKYFALWQADRIKQN